MTDAEDADRWTRIGAGDIVLWKEPDGSFVRWTASAEGRLRQGGVQGPSVEEATLGLSTPEFVKIWDHATFAWGPEVPKEIPRPPSPTWLAQGDGDRVTTDIPNGYGVLGLCLQEGRWVPDVFPYGALPWRPPSDEEEFWAEHGSVEEQVAAGRWYKVWDGKSQTGRWGAQGRP
jgi:hypothetical protein